MKSWLSLTKHVMSGLINFKVFIRSSQTLHMAESQLEKVKDPK